MSECEQHLLKPGFAEGFVVHNRMMPKRHKFRYNMSWFLLDINKIETWSTSSRCFGHNRWSLFSIYDRDYLDKNEQGISHKVETYLISKGVKPHRGNTILFTHPRFIGFSFNSVNFYFCYENKQLIYIISEINNTPWGEKHLYLHECLHAKKKAENSYVFEFDKEFHISPFVNMDVLYQWEFEIKNNALQVKMKLHQNNVNLLNVYLDTNVTADGDNGKQGISINRLFQPCKMWLGIYWQALKLWIKKVPFINHPQNSKY